MKKRARSSSNDDGGGGGWVPGSGVRVARCMLSKCRWELKKCRKDTVCRGAMQCALGCGLGVDAESRGCAFQCALNDSNRNDVSQAIFGCILENGCMPVM